MSIRAGFKITNLFQLKFKEDMGLSHLETFKDKVKIFSYPTDFQSAKHFTFAGEKIKNFHGKLESRLYTYLNLRNVEFCTKLAYAIPLSLLIRRLTSTQIAILSVTSCGYLCCCQENIISKKNKVNVLHSIALAFFANLLNENELLSSTSLIRLPFQVTFLAFSVLLANQLEQNYVIPPLEELNLDNFISSTDKNDELSKPI